mgnify:FL=1
MNLKEFIKELRANPIEHLLDLLTLCLVFLFGYVAIWIFY